MLEIQRATQDDFEAIWPIFHEVVKIGETYAFDPATSKDEAYHLWMELPLVTYVAKKERVLGTYYLKANQARLGAHVCNAGYMVSVAARGQGLGRAMCLHSQAEALELGFKAMQFNLVVSTNNGAVRLWQDLGFDVIGTLPKAFQHQRLGLVDALVMYKWLE